MIQMVCKGLYVPLSSFRETTKDIASSAMQGGNMLDNSTTSSSGIKKLGKPGCSKCYPEGDERLRYSREEE